MNRYPPSNAFALAFLAARCLIAYPRSQFARRWRHDLTLGLAFFVFEELTK